MEWPSGMEPCNSVRHNRAGRVYLMRAEALRMELLKDREYWSVYEISGW
jgi:hypothetical protein